MSTLSMDEDERSADHPLVAFKNSDSVKIHVPNHPAEKSFTKRTFFRRTQSLTEDYKNSKRDDSCKRDKLLLAVEENDSETCRELLARKDYNEAESYFFHPLFLAAQLGHSDIIRLLLDSGTNINLQNNRNSSALHMAIQQSKSDLCFLLLERGIDIHVPDRNGNLPIHLAASEGLLEVAIALMEMGQLLNLKNKRSQTPVHLAASRGHDELLEWLLGNPKTPGKWNVKDRTNRYPLHYAALNGFSKCCDVILNRPGATDLWHVDAFDKEDNTPLILAAKRGHSRSCASLSVASVNLQDSKGNTALHYAAKFGFMKTIEVLMETNADCSIANEDGNTPIHMAAMENRRECLQLLLKTYMKDPGENKLQQGLLHIASINKSQDTLAWLLQDKIFLDKINSQDVKGKTALHLAINESNGEGALALLNAGADVSIKDNNDNIALHIAAGRGLSTICKLLLQKEKWRTISKKNMVGATPLHLAAKNGYLECCNYLILRGANLTTKDSDGYTPFHLAAKEGKLEILKFFKKKKENLINEPLEASGDTPLHLAARNGHFEVCKYILNNIKRNVISIVNEKDNSALDEAFYSENDDIFSLILERYPPPKLNDRNVEFECCIHSYMQEALAFGKRREKIQRAIVESFWWYFGFWSPSCKEKRCTNLLELIKISPEIVEKVFDRCSEKVDAIQVYDFRIFEDIFYCTQNAVESDGQSIDYVISPFDMKTGKLSPDHQRVCDWQDSDKHPLKVAVDYELRNLLQHDLVRGYFNFKWKAYLKIILYSLLILEIMVTISLSLYLTHLWNWTQVQEMNFPNSFNCSGELSELLDPSGSKRVFLAVLRFVLLFLSIIILAVEIYSMKKLNCGAFMRKPFAVTIRMIRVVGILIVIAPFNTCTHNLWIATTWQWQAGIATLLISWFHMIGTLNEIPQFSVFMPVTSQFMKSFLAVLMYIILILLVFAIIFYLLFNGNPAFSSFWRAFIKSIVWMLGDLGYDDLFLDEESPILYPIMSSLIFILFVTSISGFIINLILTQPSDHLESFRNDAVFTKDLYKIRLMLKYDVIFSNLRAKHAVGIWVDRQGDLADLIRKKLYPSFNKITKDKEVENADGLSRSDINKQFNSIIDQINCLMQNLPD